MTIPQIQGWLKPILFIAAVALWGPIEAAYNAGDLTNFSMLWEHLKGNAFFAFFSALKVAMGWLLLASPLKPEE